ncbi:MAG TPA: NepR family anti-sigma factor [Beijerinckiaceae bacterium]|nr:NepR family anti-sigma factor [Beijerinckiaceae bacterium]
MQLRRAVRESRVMGIGGAPATGVGRELRDEIGKRLQASYDDLIDEPLPATLRALVEKLQAAAPKSNKAPLKLVAKERLRKAR